VTNVFISYRREDAAGHAGRLSDRLVARFGEQRVFMDVQDIQPGQNFVSAIEHTLNQCDCVLAVVGPRWLGELKEREAGREDFVRREIASALAKNITVIPVLVGGAMMPSMDQLPADIAALSHCEDVDVRDDRFDQDVAHLVDFLAGGADADSTRSSSIQVSQRTLVAGLAVLAAALIIGAFVWRTPAPAVPIAPLTSRAASQGATSSPALPNLTYGAWTLGRAIDDEGRNWSNSVLQFIAQQPAADGLVLQGQFVWRLDNILMGTEDVVGHYVERTRHVILGGSRVTDVPHQGPGRLAVGSYSAVLDDDERALRKGRWGSTAESEAGSAGTWQAVR
jgi:hypothetical protein